MSVPSNEPKRASATRPLLLVVVALAVIAGGAALLLRTLRPMAMVEPAVSAPAIDAKPGSVTVEEEYAVDIKGEQPGRILAEDFNLKLGQTVKAGQVLLRLDPKDLHLLLEKTQIDYEATQKRYAADHSQEFKLEQAEVALANARRAHGVGTISDQQLADAERNMKLTRQDTTLDRISREQNLATFKNTIETQRRAIDKMTLYAPVAGQIKTVFAHPGELLNANSPIATLITLNKNVVGKISDENFAEIRLGQQAVVTFIPYGSWVYHGTIAQILPTTDPQTQRHIVYVKIKDIEPEKLVPGINGELAVTVAEHTARAVVPRRAVFSTDQENVYVVKEGTVRLRHVKEGFVWAKGIEIREGLEPGEEVIVDGLEDFRDGDRVRTEVVPAEFAPAPGR